MREVTGPRAVHHTDEKVMTEVKAKMENKGIIDNGWQHASASK